MLLLYLVPSMPPVEKIQQCVLCMLLMASQRMPINLSFRNVWVLLLLMKRLEGGHTQLLFCKAEKANSCRKLARGVLFVALFNRR